MRAISLLSSGLDSSLALRLALEQGIEVVFALTYDYGQRAAEREIDAARQVAAHFGIPHRVLRLPFFADLKGGSLLSRSEALPLPSLSDLDSRAASLQSAKAVWVPNRNGIFIEIAAAFAESEGAEALLVGFNLEEAATFPDNSAAYREAVTKSLSFSTANGVKVLSPTEKLSKREIVREAVRLAFPITLLWSCYEAGEMMCGRCESCMRMKRALTANGVKLDALFTNTSL